MATGDNSAYGYGYKAGRIGLRGAGSISFAALTAAYGTDPGSTSLPYYPLSLTTTCLNAGGVYNSAGGNCIDICSAGSTWDATAGVCNKACTGGAVYNSGTDTCNACPTGSTYNSTTTQCMNAACPAAGYWGAPIIMRASARTAVPPGTREMARIAIRQPTVRDRTVRDTTVPARPPLQITVASTFVIPRRARFFPMPPDTIAVLDSPSAVRPAFRPPRPSFHTAGQTTVLPVKPSIVLVHTAIRPLRRLFLPAAQTTVPPEKPYPVRPAILPLVPLMCRARDIIAPTGTPRQPARRSAA